jgi:hypothetical protein
LTLHIKYLNLANSVLVAGVQTQFFRAEQGFDITLENNLFIRIINRTHPDKPTLTTIMNMVYAIPFGDDELKGLELEGSKRGKRTYRT